MKTAAMTREAGLPAACVLAAGGYQSQLDVSARTGLAPWPITTKTVIEKICGQEKQMKTATGHRFPQAYCPAEDAHHPNLSTLSHRTTILPATPKYYPFPFSYLIYFPSAFPNGGCSGKKLKRSVQTSLSSVTDWDLWHGNGNDWGSSSWKIPSHSHANCVILYLSSRS